MGHHLKLSHLVCTLSIVSRHASKVTKDGLYIAHEAIAFQKPNSPVLEREAREEHQNELLASGAARALGAGNRATPEAPDRFRTCFERDVDRIKHSKPFRRLAGKCQVFIAPDNDHLRNRLTHAIEVAQVAVSIARPLGLNVALTEAAALGHDCGHGPAGHASEDALSPFVAGGYHHAVYGADVVLKPLNLCFETLDAVRNHSWNRPSPQTAEGEVVAWADRIAYLCHDFEDAVAAGIVTVQDFPGDLAKAIGTRRSPQLHAFIEAMVDESARSGRICMQGDMAEALAAFRAFNYERIYLRPAAREQAVSVISLLQQLTEFLTANPHLIGSHDHSLEPLQAESSQALAAAVHHVSGMTDRYALSLAVEHLGWARERLPKGV